MDTIPLSSVTVTPRCPQCASPWLSREAFPQDEEVSMNGASLYTLSEECNICLWNRLVENVKLGA